MKFKFLLLLLALNSFISINAQQVKQSTSDTKASQKANQPYTANALTVRGGTGFGETFTVGLGYNYYWNKIWSVAINADFEKGKFNMSDYMGVTIYPGVDCSVWQPTNWFHLHLYAQAALGYDFWNQTIMNEKTQGFTTGVGLGFSLEFYAMPELSFVLSAQESFHYGIYDIGDYYYFKPLFSLGIRYNIINK